MPENNEPGTVTEPTNANPNTATPPRTYTQEEVQRMEANWREAQTRIATKLQKLEEQTAAAAKAAEDAKLSEVERAQKALRDAESRAEAAMQAANALNKKHALSVAALTLGATREQVEDIVALSGNAPGVELDGSGNVTGVDEYLASLKEKKPWLFGGPTATPAPPDPATLTGRPLGAGGGTPPKAPPDAGALDYVARRKETQAKIFGLR